MLNEEMRNTMIDEVAEWMADNTEFSTDFLRSHGEDWLTSYSLNDLYRDYYGYDLESTINAFVNGGFEANDCWEEYFVDDNGDLHCTDDMDEIVSEMVYDDNKYAEWCIEELEEGLITEPQELVEIFKKYSLHSWEDVACKIEDAAIGIVGSLYEQRDDLFDGDIVTMCRNIVSVDDAAEYLKKTKFCGADENQYAKIIDDLENDNLLGVITADAKEYITKMHVSFEKAIEIVVKEEYLKGRWF